MSTTDYSYRTVPEKTVPNPVEYEMSVYQKGLHYERPPFTFHSKEWEKQASEVMSANSKGYVVGSAGSSETARKNVEAFAKWSIIPKRLVKTEGLPDLSTRVFGQKFQFPIAAAPVGVQCIVNPHGEVATARAAAENNVPYIMSSASSTSIEDVAKANGDGTRWYQLYWPKNEDNEVTISILNRAKKAGFKALVVTLDTYILGWRPSDMDNGYNPFLRSDQIGSAIGLSDPVFRRRFKEEYGAECEDKMAEAVAKWVQTIIPGTSHSWEDVQFLQKHWDGPIILKGIQSVDDAKKQVDGGVSSLAMLPRIVDAVGDQLEIFFDSGVRSGTDIAKAMALGAKMVLIGRPYIYGLALGGQAGAGHVFKSLLGELELTLHLAGIASTSPEHLNRDVLVRESDLF
ncbi:FMN-dependent dehydrogenase [Penicillium chermesinum]|nr:FMN-dependent dehydrogenase [Penicillium chermesinum]